MPTQSPTLRDMIQEALDRGVTYRELQERAIDPESGQRASKDIFNSIMLGKANRIPVEHHLRAIAAALQTPYERVRRGAIAQWIPGDDDTEPPADIDLREWASWSNDDRELVLLAVRAANARARREQAGDHKPGNAA